MSVCICRVNSQLQMWLFIFLHIHICYLKWSKYRNCNNRYDTPIRKWVYEFYWISRLSTVWKENSSGMGIPGITLYLIKRKLQHSVIINFITNITTEPIQRKSFKNQLESKYIEKNQRNENKFILNGLIFFFRSLNNQI